MLNAYIWSGRELTDSEGGDGFIVIVAPTVEDARGLIRRAMEHPPEMDPFVGLKAGEDFQEWHNRSKEREAENKRRLAGWREQYGIEPCQGSYPLDPAELTQIYRVNLSVILKEPPAKIIPLDGNKPFVLAYSYGYAG